MRPCDVCGRPPKWLHCGPYEENVAVLCGYHAKAYLYCIPIPELWLKWYRRRTLARPEPRV